MSHLLNSVSSHPQATSEGEIAVSKHGECGRWHYERRRSSPILYQHQFRYPKFRDHSSSTVQVKPQVISACQFDHLSSYHTLIPVHGHIGNQVRNSAKGRRRRWSLLTAASIANAAASLNCSSLELHDRGSRLASHGLERGHHHQVTARRRPTVRARSKSST